MSMVVKIFIGPYTSSSLLYTHGEPDARGRRHRIVSFQQPPHHAKIGRPRLLRQLGRCYSSRRVLDNEGGPPWKASVGYRAIRSLDVVLSALELAISWCNQNRFLFFQRPISFLRMEFRNADQIAPRRYSRILGHSDNPHVSREGLFVRIAPSRRSV